MQQWQKILWLSMMLLLFSNNNCHASTDWIVNIVDTANGILKEITTQYETYSTMAQQFITEKVGKLGDININTKHLQRLKAKEERIKEKLEHLQRLQERGREVKARIEAKKRRLAKIRSKIEDAKEEIESKADDIQQKIDSGKDLLDKYTYNNIFIGKKYVSILEKQFNYTA